MAELQSGEDGPAQHRPQLGLFVESLREQSGYLDAFVCNDGEDGSELDGDFDSGGNVSRESESMSDQDQVAGRRDW